MSCSPSSIRSGLPRSPPDRCSADTSALEAGLAEKFGAEREGWRLRREGAILEAGGSLVIPDFVFTHEDGTEVALEIVGYWTPEYLAEKF